MTLRNIAPLKKLLVTQLVRIFTVFMEIYFIITFKTVSTDSNSQQMD